MHVVTEVTTPFGENNLSVKTTTDFWSVRICMGCRNTCRVCHVPRKAHSCSVCEL